MSLSDKLNNSTILICHSQSIYGDIGEMITKVTLAQRHSSAAMASLNWRQANEIEIAAYANGYRNMKEAIDDINTKTDSIGGLWKQLLKAHMYKYETTETVFDGIIKDLLR